jgi:putative PIN family toxin of toxin-antitoxin system
VKNAPNNYRIVIDTNVFISSIVFGGKPRELIDLIADDVLTLVIAQDLLTEIRRIIVAKFSSFLEDFVKVEKLL